MIEYFVYCADSTPIEISLLATTFQNAGWSLHVIRNWFSDSVRQVVVDGLLQPEDSLMGWPQTSEFASQFDSQISTTDRRQLESWIRSYQAGFALTTFDAPFVFAEHAEFESLNDALEAMGTQYAEHLARTKCRYLITNCPDMEFTAVLLGAIALLRDGLVEDPQSGISIAAPSQASELSSYLQRWPVE